MSSFVHLLHQSLPKILFLFHIYDLKTYHFTDVSQEPCTYQRESLELSFRLCSCEVFTLFLVVFIIQELYYLFSCIPVQLMHIIVSEKVGTVVPFLFHF